MVFAIFPVISSKPDGLLQPGLAESCSPPRGFISAGFVRRTWWVEERDSPPFPNKGPRGCCRLLPAPAHATLHGLQRGDGFPAWGSSREVRLGWGSFVHPPVWRGTRGTKWNPWEAIFSNQLRNCWQNTVLFQQNTAPVILWCCACS